MNYCVVCNCLSMSTCWECGFPLCSVCGPFCPLCIAVAVFYQRQQMGRRILASQGLGEVVVPPRSHQLIVIDPNKTEQLTAVLDVA